MRNVTGKMILKSCGRNVNIERGAYFTRLCQVGNNSGLGKNCNISGDVTIGNDVLMGPNVTILTVNHNYIDKSVLISEQGNSESKPVVIGNDVWVGTGVIILPGVNVADGCVLGAGAVVSHDTEPYSVVIGNPARIVKYRK